MSGRVLDTNGDPVPYATVRLDSGGSGKTTADGTFRFATPANTPFKKTYEKVIVHESAPFWSDVPPIVFLPDSTELQRSVQVREKQETSGLELRVSTSPHFRVTVTLRDELGGVLYNPTVMLYARNRTGGPLVRPDNTVTLGPVPRGPMTVFATADGRNGIRLAGVTELEVVDRPLDDVVITLVPAARMRGRVEFSPLSARRVTRHWR